MGKDQDLISAVRNQDMTFLCKVFQKASGRSSLKLKHRSSTKRVNVNYQDGDGMSGLHQAALMGHTEIMELLLENGAQVDLRDNKGMMALHYAAWQGKIEPVHMLLHFKSPCNEKAIGGETPLHLACQHGHFDVVNLLLLHQATPVIENKERKTPLDLACEFGRYRVVDLLLRSNLCGPVLVGSYGDQTEIRSTCLHLAAKNGHSDIIRLLLQGGMNINRATPQGTCLHEAALCGKTDVVKLLIDCGVDVNQVNSYDQTALDIVNKFTSSRASKEIKELLREASFCVQAKAVRDHCNIYDPHSLTFKDGDYIKIVEQREDGMWRGQLVKDGTLAKPGWFPADHVVLIDSNDIGKEMSVLPPPQPPSYQNIVNNNIQQPMNDEHCYVDNVEPAYQNSWDMHSSSPAPASNRNSAASTDSGRGLSSNYLDPKVHHNYVNVHVNNQLRLSGTSYESGVSSRQSYHSTSSSSVGSLDRLEESGYSSQINVAELFQAGVPDHEVLRVWLRDLNYEEYYQSFMMAGYDMPTVTHMTPQDLTAIGISKPGHRKKLKSEIARLNIHDGIPDFKPNDLYEWLRLLNLEQYYSTLANQGYDNIDTVIDITWEDLEEIGIQRLGHQKKIMLAIDRLKRIMSSSKRLSTLDGTIHDSQDMIEPPMASIRWSGERSSPPPPAPPQYNELPPYLKPRRSSSGDNLSTNSSGDFKSFNSPLLESEYANTSSAHSNSPAVVPIKVKRSLSQTVPNGLGEKEQGAHLKMCQSFHAPADRTSEYSDRENTPTGDEGLDCGSPNISGIAPVAPLVAAKPKPVALILAKSKHSSREGSPDMIDVEKHEAEQNTDGYKSPVRSLEGFKYPLASNNGSLKRKTLEHIYDTPQLGPPRQIVSNYANYPSLSMHQMQSAPGSPLHVATGFSYGSFQQTGSPRTSQPNSPGGRSKKAPPPPPKRTASIKTTEPMNKAAGSSVMPCSPVSSSAASTTAIISPPPIQQKPQIPDSQAQAFVNCVQSLSERFGKKSEQDPSADNLSSDTEESAPVVAMEIIEPKVSNYGLLGKNDKASTGEYMLQQRLKRESAGSNTPESAFGVKLRQAQNESQLHNQNEKINVNTSATSSLLPHEQNSENTYKSAQSHVQQASTLPDNTPSNAGTVSVNKDNTSHEQNKERKDSNGSGRGMDLSSSTSSLDSNTLPFANENVGTIKQRAQQSKPSLVFVLDDSEVPTGNDVVFSENTDTLKHITNKLPKPKQPKVQNLQQLPQIPQKPLAKTLHQTNQQQSSSYQQQHQPASNPSETAHGLGPQTLVTQPESQSLQPASTPGLQLHKHLHVEQGSSHGQQAQDALGGHKQQQQQQHYNSSATASYRSNSQSQDLPPTLPQKPGLKPALSPKPQLKGRGASGGKKSGDVLSEIDNMLQGLTDELDAMLTIDE